MRILFCGQSGNPSNRSATLNRYTAIAKAMSIDNEIIFVNRIPLLSVSDTIVNFDFEVIEATPFKYRQNSFILRNLLKIFSPFFEFRKIVKLNKKTKVDWVNVYTPYFGLCLFYYFVSKFCKFKTILHYVEKRSAFSNSSLLMFLNYKLLDKFSPILFDRVIPISTLLNNEVIKINPKVKTLIIPPICDFAYFNNVKVFKNVNEDYFLYCGSSNYNDVIKFIIDSFKQIKSNEVKLYLVLKGEVSQEILHEIRKENSRIKVFSKLEYYDLISFYKNALALLIPLRDTDQDIARFPQKICEYLASNRVIISTNIGEIKFYFKDKINSVLSDDYDIHQYAKKMDWVLSNQKDLEKIQIESYNLGKELFDIQSYVKPIKEFLKR